MKVYIIRPKDYFKVNSYIYNFKKQGKNCYTKHINKELYLIVSDNAIERNQLNSIIKELELHE
ncbi:hypothetical protein RBU61_08200 [Tissierella sp. MB52-C2]|uniref:hypothetical protein n=1 Tax=Tissierella sp. MB52-C2 TaxID=3070999 RepID=UPI00280B18C9|nr:hypothetical protein [Tissierella sp. MB52-C2]WMM26645.1 hypothetical protein RBU61_08200 [Tissierella sp. MB52-C2]